MKGLWVALKAKHAPDWKPDTKPVLACSDWLGMKGLLAAAGSQEAAGVGLTGRPHDISAEVCSAELAGMKAAADMKLALGLKAAANLLQP